MSKCAICTLVPWVLCVVIVCWRFWMKQSFIYFIFKKKINMNFELFELKSMIRSKIVNDYHNHGVISSYICLLKVLICWLVIFVKSPDGKRTFSAGAQGWVCTTWFLSPCESWGLTEPQASKQDKSSRQIAFQTIAGSCEFETSTTQTPYSSEQSRRKWNLLVRPDRHLCEAL